MRRPSGQFPARGAAAKGRRDVELEKLWRGGACESDLPRLLEALRCGDDWARYYACRALEDVAGSIGPVIGRLAEAFRRERNARLRRELVGLVARPLRIPDALTAESCYAALELLTLACEDRSPLVRTAAFAQLENLPMLVQAA